MTPRSLGVELALLRVAVETDTVWAATGSSGRGGRASSLMGEPGGAPPSVGRAQPAAPAGGVQGARLALRPAGWCGIPWDDRAAVEPRTALTPSTGVRARGSGQSPEVFSFVLPPTAPDTQGARAASVHLARVAMRRGRSCFDASPSPGSVAVLLVSGSSLFPLVCSLWSGLQSRLWSAAALARHMPLRLHPRRPGGTMDRTSRVKPGTSRRWPRPSSISS